jgi:hypothetical protein
MKRSTYLWLLIAFIIGAGLVLLLPHNGAQAEESALAQLITGSIYDRQAQPVAGAHVILTLGSESALIAEATSQPNGRFALSLPEVINNTLIIQIERPHFKPSMIELGAPMIQDLRNGQSIVLPDIVLQRRISPAFWIAILIFIAVLALIAAGKFHNTIAA